MGSWSTDEVRSRRALLGMSLGGMSEDAGAAHDSRAHRRGWTARRVCETALYVSHEQAPTASRPCATCRLVIPMAPTGPASPLHGLRIMIGRQNRIACGCCVEGTLQRVNQRLAFATQLRRIAAGNGSQYPQHAHMRRVERLLPPVSARLAEQAGSIR